MAEPQHSCCAGAVVCGTQGAPSSSSNNQLQRYTGQKRGRACVEAAQQGRAAGAEGRHGSSSRKRERACHTAWAKRVFLSVPRYTVVA